MPPRLPVPAESFHMDSFAVGEVVSRVIPAPRPPIEKSLPKSNMMLLDMLPLPGGHSCRPRWGLRNGVVGTSSSDSA